MSGRCRACNCVLTDDEMVSKWPGTTEYTELCFPCLSTCDSDSDDSFWSEDLISLETLSEEL